MSPSEPSAAATEFRVNSSHQHEAAANDSKSHVKGPVDNLKYTNTAEPTSTAPMQYYPAPDPKLSVPRSRARAILSLPICLGDFIGHCCFLAFHSHYECAYVDTDDFTYDRSKTFPGCCTQCLAPLSSDPENDSDLALRVADAMCHRILCVVCSCGYLCCLVPLGCRERCQ
ncbi:hypothetical protein C8F01DRAFT_1292875 [Mycena amicta]|nr:hypothetical protein C8F01DRAFT_1292875 [Mycena amicta]